VLRGSDKLGGVADAALDGAVRALEPLLKEAEHARGDERQRVLDALAAADRQLMHALEASVPEVTRGAFTAEAVQELEPFRERMAPEAYRQACHAGVARLIRERYGIPELRA
jgi:hypothetical protein